MPEIIFLNGKFSGRQDAKLSILDPGFLYGQGLFETMRAYNDKIFRLDSHIERLIKSAPVINLKLNIDHNSLKNILKSCLKKSNIKNAYLRLTVWQGEDRINIAVFVRSYNFLKKEDYEKGFRAILSTFRQDEKSALSRIKSSNYLNLLLAYQEAKSKNKDEAILLNSRNCIAEASRANIFMVKDNCLISPSLDSGCLGGITRDTVLSIAKKEKIETVETSVTCRDLEESGEAFLTNSLVEIMPLVEFDGRSINKGFPGKITEKILKRYRSLVDKS